MLHQLQKCSNDGGDIGEFFSDRLPQIHNLYKTYMLSDNSSQEMLQRLRKENPKFEKFLKSAAKSDEPDLSFLLRRPMQRLDKYVFFMDQYCRKLAPGNPARLSMESAREMLGDILEEIEQGESVADNLAKVMPVLLHCSLS